MRTRSNSSSIESGSRAELARHCAHSQVARKRPPGLLYISPLQPRSLESKGRLDGKTPKSSHNRRGVHQGSLAETTGARAPSHAGSVKRDRPTGKPLGRAIGGQIRRTRKELPWVVCTPCGWSLWVLSFNLWIAVLQVISRNELSSFLAKWRKDAILDSCRCRCPFLPPTRRRPNVDVKRIIRIRFAPRECNTSLRESVPERLSRITVEGVLGTVGRRPLS